MSSPTQPRVHDNDNVDDLDGKYIIDQFDTVPSSVPSAPPIKSPPNRPEISDDFLKEIEASVDDLMRYIDGVGLTDEELKQREAWQQQLISEFNREDSIARPQGVFGFSCDVSDNATDPEFQSHIRKAMDKLRTSDMTLSDLFRKSEPPTEPLGALFSQLGSVLGMSRRNDGQTQEATRQKLIRKEVQYELLKGLRDNASFRNPPHGFPTYLSENASNLSTEDKQRYEDQLDCVAVFKDTTFSNNKREKGAQVSTPHK
ncbi:hypothetical protein BD410DRAFT_805740 [Rickenella mellea]|uniref:Peroxin-19 n=1 Tax=Rickenella mellea TaxID=50990 RepID=A0A4Y7PY88_9AGAM|nr:hypothetical protein BD410DRAFT_805740 [Rickenella mellea]